jgi:3-hydroxymyristoyl/3-hydroxydecanoyl-(acyl carrier protein) dehydratase
MNDMNEAIKSCVIKPAEKTDRGWEKTYIFGPDFLGFQGHFPGNPIMPAILQIMIAREAIAEQMGYEYDVLSVRRAKYMKIVASDTAVTVTWTIKEEPDSIACKCTLETQGSPASKLSFTLRRKQLNAWT